MDPHSDDDGLCHFTKTARSGLKPVAAKLTPEEQAELRRKKAAFALERRREQEASEQQTKNRRATCAVCGRKVGSNAKSGISAHTNRETGKWCKGGPTISHRPSPYVRIVSGGAPVLGRR